MFGYNKFAVGKQDVLGTWGNSGGSFAQYYNVYTGNSAGMAVATSSYKINFTVTGTFESDLKAVSGFVGTLKFEGEKFKGKYTVSNWDMTTSDQNEKSIEYSVWLEAVRRTNPAFAE